jgi:hypothetical protein
MFTLSKRLVVSALVCAGVLGLFSGRAQASHPEKGKAHKAGSKPTSAHGHPAQRAKPSGHRNAAHQSPASKPHSRPPQATRHAPSSSSGSTHRKGKGNGSPSATNQRNGSQSNPPASSPYPPTNQTGQGNGPQFDPSPTGRKRPVFPNTWAVFPDGMRLPLDISTYRKPNGWQLSDGSMLMGPGLGSGAIRFEPMSPGEALGVWLSDQWDNFKAWLASGKFEVTTPISAVGNRG